jgi:septal ring factor EnvC (AmiA/AmiB activator)
MSEKAKMVSFLGLLAIALIFVFLCTRIAGEREGYRQQIKGLESELSAAFERNRAIEVSLKQARGRVNELERLVKEERESISRLEDSDRRSREALTRIESIISEGTDIIDELISFFEGYPG